MYIWAWTNRIIQPYESQNHADRLHTAPNAPAPYVYDDLNWQTISISPWSKFLMHIDCSDSCRSHKLNTIASYILSLEAVNFDDMTAVVQGRVSRANPTLLGRSLENGYVTQLFT